MFFHYHYIEFSLNPHAKSYGGMGNLFIGALGIQFFALSINRIPIFNNALITDLFNHPDPRQSFAPVPTTEVNGPMKKYIKDFAAKTIRDNPPAYFKDSKYIGSHAMPLIDAGFYHFSHYGKLANTFYPTAAGSPPLDLKRYRNAVCQVSLSRPHWIYIYIYIYIYIIFICGSLTCTHILTAYAAAAFNLIWLLL
jgi:hypothetical protein